MKKMGHKYGRIRANSNNSMYKTVQVWENMKPLHKFFT